MLLSHTLSVFFEAPPDHTVTTQGHHLLRLTASSFSLSHMRRGVRTPPLQQPTHTHTHTPTPHHTNSLPVSNGSSQQSTNRSSQKKGQMCYVCLPLLITDQPPLQGDKFR